MKAVYLLFPLLILGCSHPDYVQRLDKIEKQMAKDNSTQKEIDTRMLKLLEDLDSRVDSNQSSETNELARTRNFVFEKIAAQDMMLENLSNSIVLIEQGKVARK